MSLDWHPEQLRATGGIGGDGILKLLGAPNLDLIEVLVRETVQNSWDAAIGTDEPVDYSLHGETLTGDRLDALRGLVFGETIETARHEKQLNEAMGQLVALLGRDEVDALFVSDAGTRGLGGPIQAGVTVPEGVRADFRDFVFMIGAPSDHEYGGGSYGFGKAIGFLASAARCMLIYTRTGEGMPDLESRFIAAGISKGFDLAGEEFTGRHWWGRSGSSQAVAPVVGSEADQIARDLGFPDEVFSRSGTSLMILQPELGTDSFQSALEDAAWSLTRNFWPKMVALEGRAEPPMRFTVSFDGTSVPVPHPDTTPPLHLHAAALRAVRSARDSDRYPEFEMVVNPASGQEIPVNLRRVRSFKPPAEIGVLGIAIGDIVSGEHREAPSDSNGHPLPSPSHWAALLREPELIVRYQDAPEHFAEGLEWGAVFKPYRKWDSIFRDAEPPTHDEWAPKWLADPGDQRIVRIGVRRVAELIEEFLNSEAPADHSNPAMKIAEDLGDLLPSVPIGPKKRARTTSKGGGHGARPRVEIVRSTPTEWEGRDAARFEFTVRSKTASFALVTFKAAVAVHEDGRLDSPVAVLAAGQVADLRPIDGDSDTVEMHIPTDESWAVIVARPDGLAASAQVTAIHADVPAPIGGAGDG